MSDGTDGIDASVLIKNFLSTTGDERESWLLGIQKLLPSWIRAYDQDGLAVYYDASAKTPLPPWLTHSASYIEAVAAGGAAEVVKGGFGPRKLTKTTEPRILSALDRLLKDDLL